MHVGVRSLLNHVRKNFGRVFTTVTIALIVAVSICVFAPASYRASAILLVKPGEFIESNTEATLASFARHDQKLNTLVEVLKSPEVVGRSIDKVGIDRLFPNLKSGMTDLPRFAQTMRNVLELWKYGSISSERDTLHDDAVFKATKLITAVVKPRTDLIVVSFYHADPEVAAEFTNTLLNVFGMRIKELYARTGADKFFHTERKKYDEAFEASSSQLSAFAISNNAYAIEEQRKLTLERRNELLASAVKTRGSIIEKQNQAAETADQITNLKPIAQYPQIRDLARSTPKTRSSSKTHSSSPEIPSAASTPPLLLVKVYQETVQSLVKLKSEIAGLRALEVNQKAELIAIDSDLRKLAEDEAKFDRLKLEVDQARADSKEYSALAAKEHLAAQVAGMGFSTVEVAQTASIPSVPSFPNPYVLLPVGLSVGLLIGLGLPLLPLLALPQGDDKSRPIFVQQPRHEETGIARGRDFGTAVWQIKRPPVGRGAVVAVGTTSAVTSVVVASLLALGTVLLVSYWGQATSIGDRLLQKARQSSESLIVTSPKS